MNEKDIKQRSEPTEYKKIDITQFRKAPQEVEKMAMEAPVEVMRDGRRVMTLWIPQTEQDLEY